MVVHKDVVETHEKAHDVVTVVVLIKEKAKGIVTYPSTPALP
jgi:hypothetical protein